MNARLIFAAVLILLLAQITSFARNRYELGAETKVEEREGIAFLVTTPRICLKGGCGLIVDLAGQNMSADAENLGTHLRELVAKAIDPAGGFVLIQAGGNGRFHGWRSGDASVVYDFASGIIDRFRISSKAVGIGGFSQGAHVAALLFCGYPDRFSSAALLSGGANVAAACLSSSEAPPVRRILYVHGKSDTIVPSSQAERLIGRLTTLGIGVTVTKLTSQETIYSAKNLFVDMILHSYEGPFTGGHCIPGGEGPAGCPADVNIGEKILNFYMGK